MHSSGTVLLKQQPPPIIMVRSQPEHILDYIFMISVDFYFLGAFQDFKELPDTLWYCGSIELVLVLTVPRKHPEDVAY